MQANSQVPVSSNRFITPAGSQIGVGSFPCNSVVTPDGKYLVVTDAGFRESLSVISTASGALTDTKSFDGKGPDGKQDGLYFGLTFGGNTLYVSRGMEHQVLRFTISEDGKLQDSGSPIDVKTNIVAPVAGLAYDATTNTLACCLNGAAKSGGFFGEISLVNLADGTQRLVHTAGYPYSIAAQGGNFYATSERDGVVIKLTPTGKVSNLHTGDEPSGILAGPSGTLFVANSNSDTISMIDAATFKVKRTFLVRPIQMKGLAVATPQGMAYDAEHHSLFVALGDLNAVGVIDLVHGKLVGMMPAGWYPTSVAVSGGKLFTTNAKGIESVHPNAAKQGPDGAWGRYGPNIIEGTVGVSDLDKALGALPQETDQVIANANFNLQQKKFVNPGIKHVIYVIKENRTYDQVLGDMNEGNGDPSLCMFPKEVTPNLHALAKRFVLLDNFYCNAEVSYDGWAWSTQGMIPEYVARNTVNDYSGRRPGYDSEGQNLDLAPGLLKLHDVAEDEGGYIWDDVTRHHLSIRNYGFNVADTDATSDAKLDYENPLRQALLKTTDKSFRQFDTAYCDSDLLSQYHFAAPKQMLTYGANKSPNRFQEWLREFKQYEKNDDFPAFETLRLMRDHTAGTSPGESTPEAMVADNDYAIGELVQTISHSKYWKSTVICIVEDDSQAGYDHVDSHRSIAFVISPFVEKNSHLSTFYNTDSMLKTIEVCLGIPPMNSYDKAASFIDCFSAKPNNDAPYDAIAADEKIACSVNTTKAYRASYSARMLDRFGEHTASDLQLNDILWHALMPGKPEPKSMTSLLGD